MSAKKRKKAKKERLHREPIVRAIAELLLTGEPTPWRWTTACRHGIRAALCGKSFKHGDPTLSPWERADQHAAMIVTLARHRIGLSRYPAWRESQGDRQGKEYFYCTVCCGYIDGGHDRPWCSTECRDVHWNRHRWRQRDELAARRATEIMLGGTDAAPAQPA